MKISDILSLKKPSLSFEVFPPKRDKPLEGTKEIVSEIALTHPSFMSVTYGAAGGNTSANTLAIAEHLMHKCSVNVLAHLTCVGSTHQSISSEIAKFKNAGIENILCLRGDMPGGDSITEKSDFVHAVDLVKKLSSEGFCLGGACYPEMHPESEHITDDIAHLKEKVDAGLHFLTTQMFFDNNVYFHFLSRLRDAGVTVPVIAGIMPVTNGRQIKRICDLAGTYLPPRFRAIVDRFGEDPVAMLDAGCAYATEQIIDLFANGVNFVHVYTMNKPELARRVMGNLKGIVSGR
jgi:methylenetetrahydrofolate reductase (NADPH)